jgi:hypothetical protein
VGFRVTQEILSAYGDVVKDSHAEHHERRGGGAAGCDDGRRGGPRFEFDITDFSTEAADAQSLLNLGIESPTLKKQVFKRVALKYLCDARQEIKDLVSRKKSTRFKRRRSKTTWKNRMCRRSYSRRSTNICARTFRKARTRLQDGTAGRAQAPRTAGEAAQRDGARRTRSRAIAEEAQRAGRFARSCSGWAWSRSIWPIRPCRTGSCARKTAG